MIDNPVWKLSHNNRLAQAPLGLLVCWQIVLSQLIGHPLFPVDSKNDLCWPLYRNISILINPCNSLNITCCYWLIVMYISIRI